MAYTYILYSKQLNKYYVRHTEGSMEERLRKHLSNHDGFTAKAKDWNIVFQYEFQLARDATNFERKIKKWKSREAIEKLIGN